MKRVITVGDIIDYLDQFNNDAEVILMDDDTPGRSAEADTLPDGTRIGYVSLETMFEQFNDMGGED